MNKRILILEACGHSDETLEISGIKTQSELYGMDVIQCCISSKQDLINALSNHGQFDYVYLSSHGNQSGFCNEKNTINLSWFKFGSMVCSTECLREGGILLLSCCRGGLNEVAYDMFWNCPSIEYVDGRRHSLASSDMLIGFQLLMYNLEYRNLDPIVASSRVLNGTDIRFTCFDRMETMSDPGYINRKKELDESNWENLDFFSEFENEC
jgi:hypothetical protein